MITEFKDIGKKKDVIVKVYPKQHNTVAYSIHYDIKNSDDLNTVVKESKLALWLRSQNNKGV